MNNNQLVQMYRTIATHADTNGMDATAAWAKLMAGLIVRRDPAVGAFDVGDFFKGFTG